MEYLGTLIQQDTSRSGDILCKGEQLYWVLDNAAPRAVTITDIRGTIGTISTILGSGLIALIATTAEYKRWSAAYKRTLDKWIDQQMRLISETNDCDYDNAVKTHLVPGAIVAPIVGDYRECDLAQLHCRLVAVEPEHARPFIVEAIANPAFIRNGMRYKRDSLCGLEMRFARVVLHNPAPEAKPERRQNITGRRAVDVAKRYAIAWSVVNGSVVVPGDNRTFQYRMRLRRAGCRWDPNRYAWVA